MCDNGNEFRGETFAGTIERLGARKTHIHAGRPQTNGHVEALHKTILDECWRPAFARYLREARRSVSLFDGRLVPGAPRDLEMA